MTAIEEESRQLVAGRQAVATLAAQLASARAAHRDGSALERQLAARRGELALVASRLDQDLVDYLNAYRPMPGTAPSAEQRRVMEVKITEDLAAAAEFISEGGDYAHAIQIYRELLTLAPEDPRVVAALTTAEAERTMTRERFAALRKGLTRDQVRAVLGMPHLKNIQVFEEQGIVTWLYPTNEEGTAGVYFQAEGEGEPVVYRWDFSLASTLMASNSAAPTSTAANQ